MTASPFATMSHNLHFRLTGAVYYVNVWANSDLGITPSFTFNFPVYPCCTYLGAGIRDRQRGSSFRVPFETCAVALRAVTFRATCFVLERVIYTPSSFPLPANRNLYVWRVVSLRSVVQSRILFIKSLVIGLQDESRSVEPR